MNVLLSMAKESSLKGGIMFTRKDMDYVRKVPGYIIYHLNVHDTRIRSMVTGHDWIIVSSYEWPSCTIEHRHSTRYPFHIQRGRYKSLKEAMDYIINHDDWYVENKMKKKRRRAVDQYR